MFRKFISLAFAALLIIAVAGCTNSPEAKILGSLQAVEDAYEDANGACASPTPINSIMANFGVYGQNCADGMSIMYFENADGKSEFLDLVFEAGQSALVGPDWAVIGSGLEKIQEKMGGEIN
jgi:hypothetical protein